MKSILYLAWRYIAFHRGKTLVLTLCLSLTGVLPLSIKFLLDRYQPAMLSRAQATPLLLGAKGNRFDLALTALYFRQTQIDSVTMGDFEHLESIMAELASEDRNHTVGFDPPIPLDITYTVRSGRFPIVATSLDYFDFRDLTLAQGNWPAMMGRCILGANVAQDLQLAPGDVLFSDQTNLYDISKAYPLKMHVAGVLAPSDSPDDSAVFVDLKTLWIIAGIEHGHRDMVVDPDKRLILQETRENVVANAAIVEYNEVTSDNVDSFHMHGAPDSRPLTAIIVRPRNTKSATLLKTRYSEAESLQALEPQEVIGELLSLVFKVKRLLDANFVIILVSTGMFVALVMVLSARLRRREMETMRKIGCSRARVLAMQFTELAITVALSVFVTLMLAAAAASLIESWVSLF